VLYSGDPTSPARGARRRTLVWEAEPITFALAQADARRTGDVAAVQQPFCAEVGRRLLRAQFAFSSWVLRRVEKVEFVSDRRVSRSSSIELTVPEDAPVLMSEDGTEHWLVPLSVMRRRTLVKLDLRDEEGRSISMLGLRFTQKLDEATLRAAALLADGTPRDGRLPDELEKYIRDVVSGNWKEVKSTKDRFTSIRRDKSDVRRAYLRDELFAAALERTWHNFTLYVALPVAMGRHRLIRLAFEERVLWKLQKPSLTGDDDNTVRKYEPLRDFSEQGAAWRARLGLEPTRIRFLTPSAENCSSYHFEFSAPRGLGLSSLALLAGRPNRPRERSAAKPKPSWDLVDNPGHSGGLHAVEVPNGSLARAQVELRIASRGWLSTLMVSCWAIVLVMLSVLWHVHKLGHHHQWTTDQVTNIVLLLVTVTAGAATYVAQHHTVDVAARMVTYLRGVGTVAITIPAVAATMLVYLRNPAAKGAKPWLFLGLGSLSFLSAVAAVLLTWVWLSIRADESDLGGQPSPWDMTRLDRAASPLTLHEDTFDEVARVLEFDRPAVGVASAEGWHEVYGWSNDLQSTAVQKLSGAGRRRENATRCGCHQVLHHGGGVVAVRAQLVVRPIRRSISAARGRARPPRAASCRRTPAAPRRPA
jgi:hypothetical protein